MKALFTRLWPYMRPHTSILILAMLCMAANAAATGVYAYLVGPVVKFLFAGGLASGDSLARFLTWLGIEPVLADRGYVLVALPLLILIASAIKGLGQFGKFYLMGRFGEKTVFRLRADLLGHLHHLPLERLQSISAGDPITRITSDVTLVQEAITNAIASLLSDTLKLAVLLGVAIALDWQLALIAAIVLPTVALPIVWVGKRLRHTATHVQQARSEMVSHVGQDFSAIGLIKTYLLSPVRLRAFAQVNRRYLAASLKSYAARALASPLMEIIGALGLAATLWLAGRRMDAGTLVPEHFVSFFAAVLLLYEPLKNLGRLNNHLQSGRAGADRALELLAWNAERDDGRQTLEDFTDSLQIDRLTVRFDSRTVLDGLSLTIHKGETVAIGGESGIGKSTLARVLLRQLDPSDGRVRLDGSDLADIALTDLRKLVTLVEQRPILFDDTLEANIRLAAEDADDARLSAALDAASLRDVIARLPAGLNTPVGPEGVRLSEGEKQRVAIARAMLRRSPIIILDEITASLDEANAQAIMQSIGKLQAEHTLILITHQTARIPENATCYELISGRLQRRERHSSNLPG